MSVIKNVEVGGKVYTFEFNKYAKQAAGSVLVTCGGTQVLVTVCASKEQRPGIDFFPLTVDYIEKFYAAGRIPGGFFKRESRPGAGETLIARCIDRPLRPSFPKDYRCDTHVVATVLSYDEKTTPSSLAAIGASTALMISDLPFNGPIALLNVGKNENGDFVIDPSKEEAHQLELTIAAKPGAVLMVEAGANFLSEAEMMDAIDFAHKSMDPFFEMQKEIQKEIGKPKREVVKTEVDSDAYESVKKYAYDKMVSTFKVKDKIERGMAFHKLGKEIFAELNPDKCSDHQMKLQPAWSKLQSNYVRGLISKDSIRMDGRKLEEIRPIMSEVGILKRTHGSALFQRGETQSLGVVTLGSGDDVQRVDTIIEKNGAKTFMLHYNFPPFSVGEARPLRTPGRREIGHGALAERALEKVMPDQDEFAYTVRLVSEILESNGSSSMATVCSGSMAMMNAGVPIKEPVAGIAMGLIYEEGNYHVLSDILGDEDHLGDMDFKVCGSENGITALQMDIKVDGLPRDILARALDQAKQGRKHILGEMAKTITEHSGLSEHAPRMITMKVPVKKLKDVIGQGGKNIKKIIADHDVKVDIQDDGSISIMAQNPENSSAAERAILDIVTDPEIGTLYDGKVVKIMDFGAFIEIKQGVEGLCHISQLENSRVEKVEDVVKVGEIVKVKLIEIDRMGRLKLSRKEALDADS